MNKIAESPKPRDVNGVKIFGPDLLATDKAGQLLGPIACVFPRYGVLVTGRTIHAVLVEMFCRYLASQAKSHKGKPFMAEDEDQIYQDAVALLVRGSCVVIRSDPDAMERMFAADEILQKLVPKEKIQFTGVHLEEVREQLRHRGESWRMSPPPQSLEQIRTYVTQSMASVGTGAVYYHNAQPGGRFLTHAEFRSIKPLLRANPGEALARLKEIVELTRLKNDQAVAELELFLPVGQTLEVYALEPLIAKLEAGADTAAVEKRFMEFAETFAAKAGEDLCADNLSDSAWLMAMFCRLSDINQQEIEECVLGLSEEFYLNVQWLPGARIVKGELVFENNVEKRVADLIRDFRERRASLKAINVGRVLIPQNLERPRDERRDVLLIALSFANAPEELYVARMARWDVIHRLNQGKGFDQAVWETVRYRDYIFDRLRAAEKLGMPIPHFDDIRIEDKLPGNDPAYPVFFFNRSYIHGLASNRIPLRRYAGKSPDLFIVGLAGCLGRAALVSLALGRANAESELHFDDGDEILKLDEKGIPEDVVIAETTGSFADWATPMEELLPQCLVKVAKHLEKARSQGASAEALDEAVRRFGERFIDELVRVQELVKAEGKCLKALFEDRGDEKGGIRYRWDHMLARIESTNADRMRRAIETHAILAPYRLPGAGGRDAREDRKEDSGESRVA